MSDYPKTTSEFEIPDLKSDVKISAAIYHEVLHVVGANRGTFRTQKLHHVKFPLKNIQAGSGSQKDWVASQISDPDNWSKTPLNQEASGARDLSGEVTNSDCVSLTSADSTGLWMFYTWSLGDWVFLRARKYLAAPNDSIGSWGPEMHLYKPGGKQDNDNKVHDVGAVSACAFGDNQILVATCGTGDRGTGGTRSAAWHTITLYLFDLGNIDNKQDMPCWTARSMRAIDTTDDAIYYKGNKKLAIDVLRGWVWAGQKIDLDWFLTTDPKTEKRHIALHLPLRQMNMELQFLY